MPRLRKLTPEEVVRYWRPEERPPVRAPEHPAITAAKAAEQHKARYRVSNWSAYNQALVQRGSLTIWLAEDVVQSWLTTTPPAGRGRPATYTDTAILCMLTLKALYHLPLRQTEGLVASLLALAQLPLPVPDYSTLSRRRPSLEVALPTRQRNQPIHLVVDSSGLKIYGDGEWMVRQHGATKRRTWRKLHIGVDEATGEILAGVVTTREAADHTTLPDVLEQVDAPLDQVSGDGGYDYEVAYRAVTDRQAQPVFPPRDHAAINPWTNWAARNAAVTRVREIGRAAWKIERGYHRRSLAETAFFRLKTIFGGRLSSRTRRGQWVEARIQCATLNHLTHLGMPQSYKVAG